MNLQVNARVFLAEFIGTFVLVLVAAGAGAAVKDVTVVGAALAQGLALAVFFYVYSDISGSHFNPAVTFGLAVNKVIQWTDAIIYWVAQLLGSLIAASVLYFVFAGSSKTNLGATVLGKGTVWWQAILIEALMTFLLVTVVFYMAVAGKGKDYSGFAIGLTLSFCVLLAGPLTGGSLNPARTFGPAVYTGTFNVFWIYLLGPLLGALGAALLYRYMSTNTGLGMKPATMTSNSGSGFNVK